MAVAINSRGKTHHTRVGLNWPRNRSLRLLPKAMPSAPVHPKLTANNSDSMLAGRNQVTPGIVGKKLVAQRATP